MSLVATPEARSLSRLRGRVGVGGASARRARRADRLFPHPPRFAPIAEAQLRRSYLSTAANGGLCSPASGRGNAKRVVIDEAESLCSSLDRVMADRLDPVAIGVPEE